MTSPALPATGITLEFVDFLESSFGQRYHDAEPVDLPLIMRIDGDGDYSCFIKAIRSETTERLKVIRQLLSTAWEIESIQWTPYLHNPLFAYEWVLLTVSDRDVEFGKIVSDMENVLVRAQNLIKHDDCSEDLANRVNRIYRKAIVNALGDRGIDIAQHPTLERQLSVR